MALSLLPLFQCSTSTCRSVEYLEPSVRNEYHMVSPAEKVIVSNPFDF